MRSGTGKATVTLTSFGEVFTKLYVTRTALSEM